MQYRISLNNVSFSYEKTKVLENISFDVENNDFFAIVGPNGGGKTTILKLILGLIRPDQGEVFILGKKITQVGTGKIGYVPQFSHHDMKFPISVQDVVFQGLMNSRSFSPFSSLEDRKIVDEALEKVGLTDRSNMRFGELSGGLKQRTLIARAIVSQPEILLLDEPVASVDSSVERDIYEMLREFNEKMTILMVSHDLGFVSHFVNKVGCVNRTMVCHNTAEVTSEDMDSLYNRKSLMIKHSCGI